MPGPERKKVIRVEIEYDTGLIMRADGDEADAIWKSIENACFLEAIHGRPYSGPRLKKVKPEGPVE